MGPASRRASTNLAGNNSKKINPRLLEHLLTNATQIKIILNVPLPIFSLKFAYSKYELDKRVDFSRISTGFVREMKPIPQRTASFLTSMHVMLPCPVSGTLPSEIWHMSELEGMWMWNNSLGGKNVVRVSR